jgi:hypothetical protein
MAVLITIEQYLRGKVGYDIPDNAIASILVDRGIEVGTNVSELNTDSATNTKLKDLCTADLYLYCASTPSTISSHREQDGGWTLESGGTQHSAYDARQLRAMAQAIYDKYGEKTTATNYIKIINM